VFTRSIGNKGFYGVATASLSFDVYSQLNIFTQGTSVTLNSMNLPTFYSETVESDGDVYHVTAYDKCKNTDIPFNYSSYSLGNYYPTSQIVSAIATQCGFTAGSGGSTAVTQLGYLDLKGMSCRQILEELAKANCGWWEASGTALTFRSFSPPGAGSVISADNRTEIKLGGTKTISAIYAHDDLYNTDYQTASASFYNTEIMSGRYLTQGVAQSIASTILGGSGGTYAYQGWDISAASVIGVYGIGESVSGAGMILSERYVFDQEIVATLGAPAPDLSFSQYTSLYQRQIDARAQLDCRYNTAQITQDGIYAVPNT
jgi:hypothetical protein